MKRTELVTRYRIAENRKFRLADVNPADTWKLKSKEHAQKWLEQGVARLSELQDKLYAQNQWAVLLIFQAIDRKSTRLNSSHLGISYAVFCLKKMKCVFSHPTQMSRRIPCPSKRTDAGYA